MYHLDPSRHLVARRARPLVVSPAAVLVALAALAVTRPAAAAPTLERTWGTYLGDFGVEFTQDAGQDAAGNIYLTGTSTSESGITTAGAHQEANAGGYDAYLAKFDPTGELLWATYFGGDDLDFGVGLAVGADSVALVGQTRSTAGIATPGALQTVKDEQEDGFVASFTPDGALEWSTYIGTSGPFEQAFDAEIDDAGAVYVVGYVDVHLPGLTTAGTHQPKHSAFADGYLVKFDAGGEVVWGTYVGGSDYERLESVSLGPNGELYAAGTAFGSSEQVASPGSHQPSYGGGLQDNFLVRLEPDGTRVWSSFYGGKQQEFRPVVVALADGGVMFSGDTLSDENIASPDGHTPAPVGSVDAYLARFTADGVRLWGTYYGGNWSETTLAMTVDAAGEAYLCGEGNSITGLTTPNGYLPAPQGENDAYLAKFSGDGELRWGTYYGGPSSDGCVGLSVDALHRVHMIGGSVSPTGIATPGAHDEIHAGGYDSFVVQFTQPFGDACTGPDDCAGGPCVDGVCCDNPCGGGVDDCQACSAAAGGATDGTCGPVSAEVECRPSAGTCDAAEHCPGDAPDCPADAPAEDGAACDEGVCSAGACVPEAATGSTGSTDSTGDASTGDTTAPIPDDSTGDPTTTTPGPTTGDLPGSTGDAPTTAPDPTTDAPNTDTSGAGEQGGDAGCGCRSDAGGGLLLAPLLLLLARRRRR